MPELPEVQAHAERLTAEFGNARLARFQPLPHRAVRPVVPAPEASVGQPLRQVGRRGKYLLLDFGADTFVVHLMQGGRLKPDAKQAARAKGALARWTFADGRAVLLTEHGTERRAGVWVSVTDGVLDRPPLDGLGPEATAVTAEEQAER